MSGMLDGWRRTHNLGELSSKNVDESVTLMGWVNKKRDHGNIFFIDLRDMYGVTQVILDPVSCPHAYALGANLRNECVFAVQGLVRPRPEGMVNSAMSTGAIEVLATDARILNEADVLPFQVQEETEASETLRFKYRYLDLRKTKLKNNILSRAKFVREVRNALEQRGFCDIETPYLHKSTPEGARDFLVPSRINQGKFYALPQSPQLFKQILMVSGFDKYYQIVRCFRDEDLRSDRQPEFTQIDCEMAFVDQELILETFEAVIKQSVEGFTGSKLNKSFVRMSYDRAIEEYGLDKPDIRFENKICNLSDLVNSSGFKVFDDTVANGGIVNALVFKDVADKFSRKELDKATEFVKQFGLAGLAWAKKKEGIGVDSWQSPIAKFLSDSLVEAIENRLGSLQANDLVLFGAGDYWCVKPALGNLRVHLAKELNLYNPKDLAFLWVTDFPLFELDKETGRLMACHHPFTSPLPSDLHMMETEPLKVRAAAYDMVLNGSEIASGSIRIHNPDVQARLLKAIGLSAEELQSKFGFLLESFKYGAPPHGGIAFGLDRLVMILLGEESIKEVIAFPKTNKGMDLMTDAPGVVEDSELKDLGIAIVKEEKK